MAMLGFFIFTSWIIMLVCRYVIFPLIYPDARRRFSRAINWLWGTAAVFSFTETVFANDPISFAIYWSIVAYAKLVYGYDLEV